jgi:hypothetical protein
MNQRKSLPDCLPDWFFQAGVFQAGVKSALSVF